MADITLAEFNGRVWLVGGEAHIDDLLANTLSKDVTIELVACERKSDVHDLWIQNCGEPALPGDPWIIHPAIVDRIRRASPVYAVFFTQWSVMLDADALTVIASAAGWARDNPHAPVLLTEYLDPAGPQAMVDLSRLRAQMIEEKLAEAGVARERIEHVRRDVSEVPGMAQESQRVDIVVRAG
jgi:hypothetical protein